MNPAHKNFIFILRVCCFLLFLGRGWQHVFWDAPYRTILWNQGLLQGIVENLSSMSWNEYVTSPLVDSYIQRFIEAIGIFYLGLALFSLFVSKKMVKASKLLLVGSLSLFVLSFLYFMAKFFAIGMLIEHAIQFGLPLTLYLAVVKEESVIKYLNLFKTLIALTFIGHGMFAFGIHPTPGPFIDMFINVFSVSEETALYLLKVAGSLDFLVGILIFIPEVAKGALAFNIFWGIVTACARSFAHIDGELLGMTSHQWIFETIYRLPHGLFPLAVYLLIKNTELTQSK